MLRDGESVHAATATIFLFLSTLSIKLETHRSVIWRAKDGEEIEGSARLRHIAPSQAHKDVTPPIQRQRRAFPSDIQSHPIYPSDNLISSLFAQDAKLGLGWTLLLCIFSSTDASLQATTAPAATVQGWRRQTTRVVTSSRLPFSGAQPHDPGYTTRRTLGFRQQIWSNSCWFLQNKCYCSCRDRTVATVPSCF